MIALPIIIHFLNKRNVFNHEFSTLKFFKIIDKSSIQKVRIIQIILLIIRTIIIFLIIMMILRPTIKGVFNRENLNQSTLHAIIFDNSFSNQRSNEKFNYAVLNVLEQIPEKGELLWINSIGGIKYAGMKNSLPLNNFPFEFTYNTSNISESIRLALSYGENQYSSIELYIFTDGDVINFKDLLENFENIDGINIYMIISDKIENNLAITNVDIEYEIIIPNHPLEVYINIKNNGARDVENVLMQFIVNDMAVGHQTISLKASQEKDVKFEIALPYSGLHQARVELEVDDREEDNMYFFNLHIPEKRKIALVSKEKGYFFYIKKALESLNKNNESFTSSYYNSIHEMSFSAEQHDVIFIDGYNILELSKDSKLEEYLYNGGHIIIMPSQIRLDDNLSSFKSLYPLLDLHYDRISLVDIADESFQMLDLSNINDSTLGKLFLSTFGKDRNIKLFKYLSLPSSPAFTLLQSKEGLAIWNRHQIHSGILDVIGFNLNLNWTNFPLKGTFLPYINFLIYSKNSKDNINLKVDDNIYIYQNTNGYDRVYHISPDGAKNILSNDKNNIYKTDILKIPGYHTIFIQDSIILSSAVNISKDELVSAILPYTDMKNRSLKNIYVLSINDDIGKGIQYAQIGIEIWRYILYLIAILLIIEMLISNGIRKS